jgi:hypothetical protein
MIRTKEGSEAASCVPEDHRTVYDLASVTLNPCNTMVAWLSALSVVSQSVISEKPLNCKGLELKNHATIALSTTEASSRDKDNQAAGKKK